MFQHLTNFGYKRNLKEAVGFYLAYLLFVMICSFLVTVIFSLATGVGAEESLQESMNIGIRYGSVVGMISSIGISTLMVWKKGLLGEFKYLVVILISGILAFFGGGVLGLIPAAYLSTK